MVKIERYEIVELAGTETRRFWILDNAKNKVLGNYPTWEMAEDEIKKLP